MTEKYCNGLGHSSFLCLFLMYWQDPAFFPVFLLPKFWAVWNCILLSCRNLEPCDLKMQSDFQSVVVKRRINYMLLCYINVLHLRITEYLEYSLFNLHKIWGKIFCHPIVDFPCLLCKRWPPVSNKGKSCFLLPWKKSTMSELYIS